MKQIWNHINQTSISCEKKDRAFLLIVALSAGIAGLLLKILLPANPDSAVEWTIIFAGYPAAIAWFAAVLYLFKFPFK